jgi:response regulator RpfG family c-di-GMP phosphodiesterase
LCRETFDTKRDQVQGSVYCHYIKTHSGHEIVIHLICNNQVEEVSKEFIRLFGSNVMLSFENLMLNDEMINTQHVLMGILGSAMESRSKETGAHVRRVGEYSALLAQLVGMDGIYVERIRNAAPLHDVGKVSTPDAILNKPGKLTAEEWVIMQQHAEAGYQILEGNENRLVQMAANIARDHHEKWNGQGYPNSTEGENISLEGRICALADVFDALISKRCYKEAWTVDDAFAEIEKSAGSHFDPQLATLMLTHREQFVAIHDRFPD